MQLYLPIAEIPLNVFLLLAMGWAVGFISGMFGVGGGFLLTPFLIFVGVPPAVAVATSSVQIAASSVTGVLNYWRRRALDFKLGLILVLGGLIGTVLGVLFFNAMRRLGQLELIITLSYVSLLSTVGLLMAVESGRALMKSRRAPARLREAGEHRWYEALPLKMRFHQSKLYMSAIPPTVLGIVIGFIGTVLGIGGGFLVVPALIYMFRVPTNVVIGTSLFQILFTMLVATMLHALTSQTVDVLLGLVLVVGGVIGAQFGARTGQNLRGEQFRLMLALLILMVGARFAADLTIKPDELFSIGVAEPHR